jgi:REP element-mobilizing transposase RayT
MRAWLLSNTTYGTWLPGDPRGSVTSVRDRRADDPASPFRFEHDIPGEPWEDAIPGLQFTAREQMKGTPIYLDIEKANKVLTQFQATAAYRGWTLRAVAIMTNHFHLVVQVSGDPEPAKMLADFKAYASRRLNREHDKPLGERWWTEKGSKRKLPNEDALANANYYVLYKQPSPLVVWCSERGRIV